MRILKKKILIVWNEFKYQVLIVTHIEWKIIHVGKEWENDLLPNKNKTVFIF